VSFEFFPPKKREKYWVKNFPFSAKKEGHFCPRKFFVSGRNGKSFTLWFFLHPIDSLSTYNLYSFRRSLWAENNCYLCGI